MTSLNFRRSRPGYDLKVRKDPAESSGFSFGKGIALAFSGVVYVFAMPFVLAEGFPFIALWAIVGLGLVNQLILAIAPNGLGQLFPRLAFKGYARRSVDLPHVATP